MASRYTVGATLTASSGSFVKGFNRANAAALALRSSLNQVNGALARTHGALNSSGLGNRAVVSNVGRLNSNLGRMGANAIYASDNLNNLNKRTSRLTRLASGTALYGLSREFNRVGTNSMEASRGISNVGDSAKKSNKYTQWMERDLDRFNRTARGISMTAIGATAALTGSVRKSLQSFGSYESALAGVKKTVDGTDREFRELDLTFRQMNRTMPATYEEIAGVAEIAGQLGIEKKHIATFTETMVRMGTSTNLSAEEAATALARLSNIMGTSQGDVDRLGSTVVKMGNNYASTEREILNMSLRIAGMGKTLGMAESDVVALSATLSSLGIRAEMGGSAISTTMSKIASEISRGTEKGQKWAEVMGMSIEEVQHLFEVDAYGALIKMVEGLEKVDASGGNVDAMLRELGITEIRQLDVMKRLIGSSEDLANAQRMAADEYRNNNELMRESEERYKTFEAQMQKLKNGIENIWANIGGAIAKSSGEMIEWINQIISNVERMTDSFFDAEGGLTETGEAFARFIKVVTPVVAALGVVGGAFMLFGPAGLYALAVIGGLGAIAGAFGLLTYELNNSSFEKAMNKISSSAEGASKESIDSFTRLRQGIYEDMNKIQLESGDAAEKTKERIVNSFKQLHDEIRVLNDEEQGKMIAMVEKRMETATGKELEALKQLKNQIIEDYKDLDNTLDAHIRTISNNMKDVIDENGKVNTDALRLIANSAKKVDEIAGTSISNSMTKLAEYGEALSDVEIKEMSSSEVKKTLKSATKEAASALEETTIAYEQNRKEIEASNLSDKSKSEALAMLDQEYMSTRQGVLDYVSALIESAEANGHNVKSLGKLSDEQKRSLGLTEKEIMTNHLRKRSVNSAKMSVDEFKDSYKRASEEARNANEAWDEAVEGLSKLGEEFGSLPKAIEASKGESSAAAERLGQAVALSTEGGIKAVDLGDSGTVMMDDFVEGLRSGEYSAREVGLGIVNKLRSTIGLESLNKDGFKKMEEFVSGLQSGEQNVEQFAQNLGLNLSEKSKIDLGPSGEVSMKDFTAGLQNGTYGVEELAIGLTNQLQSSLEVDLSSIGEQDIRTLSTGLKSGLITVDDITNTLGQNLKDGATVELGDKGKYTIGTLVEGLSSGELQIGDVMEGIEALMEEKSKIDLTSQAQETMNGYVNSISEQTGKPVEEIESMIKQMYEATGTVDFSAYGIEVPQEIADGVNTEAPKLYQTAEEMMQQLEESLKETEGATEAGQQIPEDMSSGIDSTFDTVIQSAEALKEGAGDTLATADDKGGGENAGKSFLDGLIGYITPARASAAEISEGTEQELGTTDDGGGGTKAGENFTSSLAVYNPIAMAIANSLKSGTESELGTTTDGNGGNNAGEKFTSGLQFSLTPAQQIAEMSKGNVEGTLGVTSDGGGGANAMETFASQMFSYGVRAISTADKVVNNVQNSLGRTTDGGGGDKAMSKFNTGLSTGGNKAVKSSSSIVNRVKNTLAKATDGKGGNRAGNQFYRGIQGNVGKIQNTSRNIVNKVKGTLSRATDGRGGNKVGREFASGIRSHIGNAGNAATSMASGARNRIRANSNTYGLGANFGSGFVRGIRSYIGAAISAATALARSALNAVKRTQRSASPSKETIKLGGYFGDGFALAIEQSSKKAEKASKELARSAMSALDESLNTNYGEIMSSSINGFDVGENNLQRELIRRNELEMSTREDINVNVVNQINGRDYEVFVKDVSREIDKQKKREARF